MHTEERADGHGWREFCLDGADLRASCRRVHIEAMHSDRHAATSSHAHEGEAVEDLILNRGYGKLLHCHPTAVRRGVGGFRVAKHLHLPITRDKQAETAGRERYDARIGERTERFRDGLNCRRVVLLSAAGELDVAIDRDDASDAT